MNLNRRKFLQLCVVGAVAAVSATRRLITGGGEGEKKEPEPDQGGYVVPDEYKTILMGGLRAGKQCSITLNGEQMVEYELQKSMHVSFTEDRTAWHIRARNQEQVPGPAFVILEPSKEMVKELEDLKATRISILARYT